MPATTANRIATGTGCLRSVRPSCACATNNDSTPKIMKTFHSSGTPIGIADRIPKWKHTITNRRDRCRPAAVGEEQRQRHQHLDGGADVRKEPRQPSGPQVVGELLEEHPFEPPWPHQRVVGHHRGDHEREVLVEFRRRRAHPDHQEHQLGGDDHVDAGEQERHASATRTPRRGRPGRSPCRAGRARASSAEDRHDLPRRQHPTRAQLRIGPVPSENNAHQQHHQQRGVEHDVERRAVGRPWSAVPGRATVAAGSCWAATSTGSSPSAGRTGCSAARSRSRGRRPRTASCRARPSRRRSAPTTTHRHR